MQLVEKHIIKPNDDNYKELDNLCFLSKNLYNATLYTVRQYFFETGKYMGYEKVNKEFTDTKQPDYCALPRKVSKLVQKLVASNFNSFFALNRKKKNGQYNESVHIPGYLDKVNGRQVLTYTKQALSFKKPSYVQLSQTNIYIKTDKQDICFVRVSPKNGYIVLEVGYKVQEKDFKDNNSRYAAIDIGVNNLAAITSNVMKPIIINGKPLKSINQYYNKTVAEIKSELEITNKQKTSNKVKAMGRIRTCKIEDYFHKATNYITNLLVSNNINTLIIGHNKGWKQDVNMYKKDKQTFIQIPFLKFVNMLTYKCELEGINVVLQEESYTSKCSFINQDYIPTYGVDDDKFNASGNRVKRGLFKNKNQISNNLKYINADINGSYNILKKYLTSKVAWNESLYLDCVEVCSTPLVKSF